MGFMIRFFIWRSKDQIHLISTLRNAHKIMGWALVVMTAAQCYFGWERFDETYDEEMLQFVYIFYFIIGLIYMIFELNHQLGSRFIFHPFAQFRRLLECRPRLLPEMSYHEVMDLISKGRKLVTYDDIVLDVAGYMWSHPGGAVMFEVSLGQDAGKYLHGCSSISEKFNPYEHSRHAFKLAR